jgi:hypothetical protein
VALTRHSPGVLRRVRQVGGHYGSGLLPRPKTAHIVYVALRVFARHPGRMVELKNQKTLYRKKREISEN